MTRDADKDKMTRHVDNLQITNIHDDESEMNHESESEPEPENNT